MSAGREYAKAAGARLRAIRIQQGLSLQGVEQKSRGRWKTAVVGSYERGDRMISVHQLSELAGFYGVPVSALLPEDRPWDPTGAVLDLVALGEVDGAPEIHPGLKVLIDWVGVFALVSQPDMLRCQLALRREHGPVFAAIGERHGIPGGRWPDMLAAWGVLAKKKEAP